jgi:hypothetical protein
MKEFLCEDEKAKIIADNEEHYFKLLKDRIQYLVSFIESFEKVFFDSFFFLVYIFFIFY